MQLGLTNRSFPTIKRAFFSTARDLFLPPSRSAPPVSRALISSLDICVTQFRHCSIQWQIVTSAIRIGDYNARVYRASSPHMYVHARTIKPSNRKESTLTHMCVMQGDAYVAYAYIQRDKRAATSADPPGRGLRICRLSPLI